MTLQHKIIRFIQHLESIEVLYTHADLPRASAQIIIGLPKDERGSPLQGPPLLAAIAAAAPARAWFEVQQDRLTAAALPALPPELLDAVPLIAGPAPAWYEDAVVEAPSLIDGTWARRQTAVDLRGDEANLQTLKERMKAQLADVRYQHETAGIVFGGARIKTDRESQATITGAYARALSDPATTVRWKSEDGFVTLDSAAIIAVGAAVFDHVQGCFSREGDLSAAIDGAATVDQLLGVNIVEGWEAGQ